MLLHSFRWLVMLWYCGHFCHLCTYSKLRERPLKNYYVYLLLPINLIRTWRIFNNVEKEENAINWPTFKKVFVVQWFDRLEIEKLLIFVDFEACCLFDFVLFRGNDGIVLTRCTRQIRLENCCKPFDFTCFIIDRLFVLGWSTLWNLLLFETHKPIKTPLEIVYNFKVFVLLF